MGVDTSRVREMVGRWASAQVRVLAEGVAEAARGTASRRSGALVASIEVGEPVPGVRARCVVSVGAPHGRWQEEGTGIYGPSGRRIRPRRARVLRFDWPAAGGIVFAASVAGSEPSRWWSRALGWWPEVVRRA